VPSSTLQPDGRSSAAKRIPYPYLYPYLPQHCHSLACYSDSSNVAMPEQSMTPRTTEAVFTDFTDFWSHSVFSSMFQLILIICCGFVG
jgi:hypothetical protein